MKVILDLCGGTGAWSKPYKDNGYDIQVIDVMKKFGGIDVRTYTPPDNVYGILAAPPCTEFSIAKNHNIERDYETGMEIVDACLRIIKESKPTFWALENPIGMLSKFLGKPNYSFQPYEFGDPWTKRTMIWGEFNKPKKQYKTFEECPNKIPELYVRPGRKTPSIAFNHVGHKKYIKSFDAFRAETDAEFRAITPQGWAHAFYKANP